jgi:hypothetical protein
VQQCLPKVERFLRDRQITPIPGPIRLGDRAAELGSILPQLRTFLAQVQDDRVAYDLTPGYKSISLALDEVAPSRSWRIYCRHAQLPPDRRVNPGTEHYDAWQGRGQETALLGAAGVSSGCDDGRTHP